MRTPVTIDAASPSASVPTDTSVQPGIFANLRNASRLSQRTFVND